MNITKKNLINAIEVNVNSAIDEDIKSQDKTSFITSSKLKGLATVKANQNGILCGISWFEKTFKKLDPNVKFKWFVDEAAPFSKDQKICEVLGKFNLILSGERIALNFLQTLSGTATVTNTYVKKIKSTSTKVFDTRKTIPGLRIAQKYAVKIGGGSNQRLGLYDSILIKENHIKSVGSIKKIIQLTKEKIKDTSYQIEVENLEQLEKAINNGAKNILLDNFSIKDIKKAISINKKQAILEASGNITISNILHYAKTGIPRISIGALTKNVEAIDFSMLIEVI